MPDGVDLRGFTALASAAATSADDPDPTEQALLGALLTQGRLLEALPRGPGGFTVHCFADERHRRIYRAIEDVYDAAAVDAPIALVGPKLCDGDAALRHYLVLLPRAARSYQPETIARMGRVLAERHLRARIIEELQAGVRDAGAVPPRALAARLVASLDLLTTEDPEGHRAVLLGEAVDAAMAKVEAARMKGGPTGIATGIPDLDRALLNMDRQELILIGGRTGMGKAQPLDAPVLAADGSWKPMGEIKRGDSLASIDGDSSRVIGVYDRGEREVFRVTFSDGRATEVCGDHLWRVHCWDWDESRVLSTSSLASMLGRSRYKNRLSIDLPTGDFGSAAVLPLDPYVLGVLLGDAHIGQSTPRLSNPDAEIIAEVDARLIGRGVLRAIAGTTIDYCVTSGRASAWIPQVMRDLGLAGKNSPEKFVPECYMRASRSARLDLLRGLMDTDGWCEKFGAVRFSTSSPQLAMDVQSLVRSLGGLCSIKIAETSYSYKGERRAGKTAYICGIRHEHAETFFLLPRKAERAVRGRNSTVRLTFTKIESTGVKPTRCIAVTHPSHLYITTDYILTHNTTLAMAIARGRAHLAYGEMQGQGEFQGGIYVGSLEMSSPQLAMRMLASEAGVSYESMQLGQVGAAEMEFLADARRRLNPLPMVIDDAANQTMGMLAAGARDAARKFGRLSLVVIDHATIVKPDDKSAATRNPVFMFSAISNAAKRMAKELDVPVLLLVQLNRNVENRENKRPQMSDLNWSGSFEQDADTVIFVYREWYYLNQEGPPQRKDGEADTIFSARLATYNQRLREAENALEAIVAKLRRGKPRTLNMYFDGDTNTIRGLDLHHVA